MQDIVGSIWWLIVSLGILVTFHEFGHYWVARRCGVRVLRFSVGFGKPLWKRIGRDGTEYVIAALPLGGYVKMLDEREADVPVDQLDQAFNRKSVAQRIAIVAAGPIFNLLLCLLLLWGMFLVGKGDYQPLVGRADGIAAEAGFAPGDRILRIGDQAAQTWTHVAMSLMGAALDRRTIAIEVTDADGQAQIRQLELGRLPAELKETELMREIGLVPQQILLPPVIGLVAPGSPAEAAGLKPGDRIRSLDGAALRGFDEVAPKVRAAGEAGRAVIASIEREGGFFEVSLRPEASGEGEARTWRIGVGAAATTAQHDALLRYGPVEAVGAAFSETWRLTTATFGMLYRMVTGAASLQNLSGPISIAQYANDSAQRGLAWFLFFLGVLSLSLCIMNLLPIPILDGGHLLYYLIEAIKGAPVSEKSLILGQYVGLAMLGGLMALAFYNDILRLFSS
ncbi:RIP metalloprotease RseP [Aquimonas voraii]|uniref:Zinc metalloprotease n=1 Tax=Aquimonas voraii TaxID=265719 RepID=A0A1G6S520_9GAMM|nr:RIP metalloprotease RseP [Aquimonas voraii]SDD11948.1 site-2 protease. Metallo peptidase. MEROPS family M50B [Aquimonas voraii]